MVTRTERGIRTLSLLEADRLTELLGVTIEDLLGYPPLTERQWAASELEALQTEIGDLIHGRIERLQGQD